MGKRTRNTVRRRVGSHRDTAMQINETYAISALTNVGSTRPTCHRPKGVSCHSEAPAEDMRLLKACWGRQERDRGRVCSGVASWRSRYASSTSTALQQHGGAQRVTAGSSLAGDDKVGEFAASGFFFKDTVEVQAHDDPDGDARRWMPDRGAGGRTAPTDTNNHVLQCRESPSTYPTSNAA